MILGLTGGIASGKTTVSNFLKEKGIKIYDADKIAKEISEQKNIVEKIVKIFGEGIINQDKKIDRTKMKELVFSDKSKLKKLNQIIHPEVYKFYEEKRKKNIETNKLKKSIEIFDISLLFESEMEKLCDKILLITAEEEVKIRRIMQRDCIEEKLARKIILSQLSDKEKKKKSDVVIENNGNVEELLIKVERFWKSL